jgi:GTP-binding protein YchF
VRDLGALPGYRRRASQGGFVKIGLVGFPGSGKSTVFGALTGMAVETGYGAGKANLGVVKVPDARVDALAALYAPKKTTYAEITFSDLGAGKGEGLDRTVLNAMRNVDALCQVLRAFPDAAGEPGDPLAELTGLETETLLADLEVVEQRVARLAKDRSNPRELELMQRVQQALENEQPVRSLELTEEEEKSLSGYALLTNKPLLLVQNVTEAAAADPAPEALARAAEERGLGLVVLSAAVEMDIAQLDASEQGEFLASLGFEEPAVNRFIRAAFDLIDLISMLTAGPDECRAWPVPRGIKAPRAAGKIHSDIERGFIRAEVIRCEDLLRHGSEAKCKEAGALRVEGKEYVVQDGDVVHFRFNV